MWASVCIYFGHHIFSLYRIALILKKIYFSWELKNGDVEPVVHAYSGAPDHVDLMACLLMDEGGVGYGRSVVWLDKGLRLVMSVKTGIVIHQEWSRETWSAFMQGGMVEICSLYDEDYCQSIEIERFEKILMAWREFLFTVPQLGFCTMAVEY